MSTRTYRAAYGGKPCRWITSDDRTGTVLLDRDPGYGSMIFGRIGRSQVELGELEQPPDAGEVRRRERDRALRFVVATTVSPERRAAAERALAEPA